MQLNRRELLSTFTTAAATAAAFRSSAFAAPRHYPIGLELYSVRDQLAKDLKGTVREVAKLGYECVEFYAPYFRWTPEYAKEVRALLDELHIKCLSTHNDMQSFTEKGLPKAIELNRILGAKYIVMAHPGNVKGLDGWKKVADVLNKAVAPMKDAGMRPGYHNHDLEFRTIDGGLPIDIICGTDAQVGLQVDTGGCLEGGGDPAALIAKNKGRVFSLHCKEWSNDPKKGFRVLIGDGINKWKEILAAAEANGGLEYFLVEQEGADLPPMETAGRCLELFKKLRGEA